MYSIDLNFAEFQRPPKVAQYAIDRWSKWGSYSWFQHHSRFRCMGIFQCKVLALENSRKEQLRFLANCNSVYVTFSKKSIFSRLEFSAFLSWQSLARWLSTRSWNISPWRHWYILDKFAEVRTFCLRVMFGPNIVLTQYRIVFSISRNQLNSCRLVWHHIANW